MKSKTIKYILVFFNIVILSSLGWSQCDGCNPDTIEYWDNNTEEYVTCLVWINNVEDCNSKDFDYIQLLSNSVNINNPTELGSQMWKNDRLLYFNCEQCGLTGELPVGISQLDSLEHLNLKLN